MWWSCTPVATGGTVFETSSPTSSTETLLAVYEVAGDTLTEVAFNDDIDAPGGNFLSRVDFLAETGTTYLVRVDGYGINAANPFTLLLVPLRRRGHDHHRDLRVPHGLHRHLHAGHDPRGRDLAVPPGRSVRRPAPGLGHRARHGRHRRRHGHRLRATAGRRQLVRVHLRALRLPPRGLRGAGLLQLHGPVGPRLHGGHDRSADGEARRRPDAGGGRPARPRGDGHRVVHRRDQQRRRRWRPGRRRLQHRARHHPRHAHVQRVVHLHRRAAGRLHRRTRPGRRGRRDLDRPGHRGVRAHGHPDRHRDAQRRRRGRHGVPRVLRGRRLARHRRVGRRRRVGGARRRDARAPTPTAPSSPPPGRTSSARRRRTPSRGSRSSPPRSRSPRPPRRRPVRGRR